MKTLYIIIGIFILVVIAIFILRVVPHGRSTFVSLFPRSPLNTTPQATATIDGHPFKLLLAETSEDQRTGLSDRDSLPQDTGMLFIFSKPDYYLFWMRHMKFPLDIIYMNKKKVVTIFNNVKNPPYTQDNPPVLKPSTPADSVIEINAGLAKKYNIKVGDTIAVNL